eukprot:CAMPEP_0176496622 /NCGR_PEP_ID=MMETSP0200_2-20121128/11289_1 /TAXON_ID=947934 /ORGANISM="Chaetoceros sp., Strain GSL56" /LENGTH=575 /DNA_ID=CAMNT_0017894581 /DNA_START=205 /DNA_END=1932 /DNA_ORIENTATION=-
MYSRQRPLLNPLTFPQVFLLLGTLFTVIQMGAVQAFTLIPSAVLSSSSTSLSLHLNRFMSSPSSTGGNGSMTGICCMSSKNKIKGSIPPRILDPSSSLITRLKCRNSLQLTMVSSLTTTMDPKTMESNSLGNNYFVEEIGRQEEQLPVQDIKVGVLLLNLGGPEKTQDVEGFLYNLFADPDIIRLPPPLAPLQKLIALIISKRRAPKSIAAYESIGGGSPILYYSNQQASLVQKSLAERYGLDVKTYVGMRYWYPFTEEALEQIQTDGINALVVVPLYPQFSISTSGSSLRVLQEEFARNSAMWGGGAGGGSLFTHTVIPAWYDRPGYVKAMANIIQRELDSFTPEEVSEQLETNPIAKHVLFSAHGVPQSYIEAGDPYQEQIQKCVQGISKLLPSEEEGVKVHLSYQSRVGPIEWLRPYTDDVLPELGRAGVKNLVVVPISFVSEHIETLEEIDIEYRELAEESGITHWRRAQALNTDPTFINDMADMIVEALNQPSQSVTEACVANNVGLVDLEDEFKGDINSAGVGGVGYNDELQSQVRLKADERFYGRIAIMAVITAVLIEVLSGRPIFGP